MTGFHADAAGVVGPAEVVDAHDLRLAGEFDADSSGSLGTNLLDEAPDDRVVSDVAVGQRNSLDHDVLSNVFAEVASDHRVDEVARVLAGDVYTVRVVRVDQVVADAISAARDDQ